MSPQALCQVAVECAWGPQAPTLNIPRSTVGQPLSVLAGSRGTGWKVNPTLFTERFEMQAHKNAEQQRDALLEKLSHVHLWKKEIKSGR